MKKNDNTEYIGVNFKSTSKKYVGKVYYYKTDKSPKMGEKIAVKTNKSSNAHAIVSKTNIKDKPTNKKIKTY